LSDSSSNGTLNWISLSKRVTEIGLVRYAIVSKVEMIGTNGSVFKVSSKMDLDTSKVQK
jgi:hypothetical protein